MDRRLMAMAIVAGWTVFGAACGGDDDGGDEGSSGTSGSFTGRSGTGGRGGSSGIGTGTAGTGTSGAGGRGMNPTGCPGAAPMDNSMCTMDGLDCTYGMTDCTCEMGRGGGGMLQWDCNTGGTMMMMMCPATEPMNGSACTSGPGDCMYGARICDCPGDTDTWACWDPADCPATQPAEQSACMPVGMECDYEGMGGNNCDCEMTGWDCGAQFCPASEPTAGEMCDGGDGVCTFGGRVCDCDMGMWVCWNASDCPATPPVDQSACTLDGMICEYDGGECECDGPDGWNCDQGVGSEPDAGM